LGGLYGREHSRGSYALDSTPHLSRGWVTMWLWGLGLTLPFSPPPESMHPRERVHRHYRKSFKCGTFYVSCHSIGIIFGEYFFSSASKNNSSIQTLSIFLFALCVRCFYGTPKTVGINVRSSRPSLRSHSLPPLIPPRGSAPCSSNRAIGAPVCSKQAPANTEGKWHESADMLVVVSICLLWCYAVQQFIFQ